ncbi:MAG: ThuA domain-containing protein [Pseudomonadota bacterium]
MAAKMLKGLALTVLVLLLGFLGFAWYIGAWNLVVPSTDHDRTPPVLPDDLAQPAILVFSKTNGFRHKDGIAGGQRAMKSIAKQWRYGLFLTENGAVFNQADLARFQAVIFLNATGDMLSREQEQAFEVWLEDGGGWLGIHAAGDGSHSGWPWYMDNLIGTDFTAHIMGPQFQIAQVVTENHDHPVNSGLDNVWEHEEEWYSWERSARAAGMRVLATVSEDSYRPVQNLPGRQRDLSMGDHPISWSNCVGQGRSVYTAIGHRAAAFDVPQVRRFLSNAVRWLIGDTTGGCPPANSG